MRVPLSSPELADGRPPRQGAAKDRARRTRSSSTRTRSAATTRRSPAPKDACFLVWHEVDKGAQAALIDPGARHASSGASASRRAAVTPPWPFTDGRPGRGRVLRGGPRARRGDLARRRRHDEHVRAGSRATSRAPWIAPGRARGEWLVSWLDVEAGAHRGVRGAPAMSELTPAGRRRRAWAGLRGALGLAPTLDARRDGGRRRDRRRRSAGTRRSSGSRSSAPTWALVWRKDDDARAARRPRPRRPGDPRTARRTRVARAAARALAWARGAARGHRRAVLLRAGGRGGSRASRSRSASGRPTPPTRCSGQLLVIALPEEAFYRGYLQSRLDESGRRAGACSARRSARGGSSARRSSRSATSRRCRADAPRGLLPGAPLRLAARAHRRHRRVGLLPRLLQHLLAAPRARLRRLLKTPVLWKRACARRSSSRLSPSIGSSPSRSRRTSPRATSRPRRASTPTRTPWPTPSRAARSSCAAARCSRACSRGSTRRFTSRRTSAKARASVPARASGRCAAGRAPS